MALVWNTKPVTVTGLEAAGDEFATAELVEISHPYGDQWGTCLLNFPRARAQSATALRGVGIVVKYDGRVVFAGHIVELPRSVGGNDDGISATAADLRWLLSKRKVGQYGTGEIETDGGWQIVGYRPHFNPAGRRNRGTEKTTTGEGDAAVESYVFSDAADAAAWTAADILEFLIRFYAPTVTLDLDTLPDAWDAEIPDFFPYGKSIPAVITELASQVGCSWSLRYVRAEGEPETTTQFVAIALGATETSTVTLPEHGDGTKASSATAWAARTVTVMDRITDSVDRIEVHAARTRIDMTFSTETDAQCVKCLKYFAPALPGFCAAYRLDLTAPDLSAAIIACNLPSGARPVRWHRQLATLTTATDDDYETAESASLKAGIGNPVMAEQCVWLQYDEADPQLVRAGIRIDPVSMILYIEDTVQFVDGGELEDLEPGDHFGVWISAAVEWTHNTIARTPTPNRKDLLLSSGSLTTDIVVRSDIIPQYRYRLVLPDKAHTADAPNERTSFAKDAIEGYNIQTDTLTAMYEALQAARRREVTVVAELLDIPEIIPGAKLAIAPADLDLTGDEIVTHYSASFRETSRVTLYATNNIARLTTGDLPV